ncbi:MAG: hypothetical protein ACM3WP_25700 [Acidobacteriota bacterium]
MKRVAVSLTNLCNIDHIRPACDALTTMPRGFDKSRKYRPPRIRVPNQQKAMFIVDHQKLIGVVQRLSATGGSVLLAKGPVTEGTLGEIVFGTVFGKVNAHVEFLHKGADGVRLAQAFAFLTMDARSSQRFQRALEEMHTSDLSDSARKQPFVDAAFEKLCQSVRQLSGILSSARRTGSKL